MRRGREREREREREIKGDNLKYMMKENRKVKMDLFSLSSTEPHMHRIWAFLWQGVASRSAA